MNQYLKLFLEIGDEISLKIMKLCGTEEGRKELSLGAGRDITLLIDKVAEDIIIEKIRDKNIRLISEEIGIKDFGRPEVTIIADPLDGSFNAKRGIPIFACSKE